MTVDVASLLVGDRIYTWWHTGAMGADQLIATVVRVNRTTVTLEYHGQRRRIARDHVAHNYWPWTDEEAK